MSKKHKEPKFGLESVMRLAVFAVLMFLAINYLSNSKSSLTIPAFDTKVLGAFSPQIENGQKWLETTINKFKLQALDQIFENIKKTIIK